ncbi:MAG: hypothetical protein Q9200_002708 [Gallowayella weberi]
MPRTRAALRSQASPDEAELAATVPLPATPPVTRRSPLGEITGNKIEVPLAVDDPEEILKANKGTGKGKKGHNSKKSKNDAQNLNNNESREVLPDENESQTSTAVDDACQNLLNEHPQDMDQALVQEDRPQTPPSPAVTAATKHLSPALASSSATKETALGTAHMGHSVVEPQTRDASTDEHPNQTRDLDQTLSGTGLKSATVDERQEQGSVQESRKSQATSPLRPEDSIEAIDKFEEEMEKVGDLIPTLNNKGQSPKITKKPQQKTPATKPRIGDKVHTVLRAKKGTAAHGTTSGPDVNVAAPANKRVAVVPAILPGSEDTNTAITNRKISDSSSTSEDKTSVTAKKRISSVHKAPFVPAKSTKPPTRANFELPGEAVARKLREARDERMKREEEEKMKSTKTTFKARPVRLSQAPMVKPTATSKARISMAKGEMPAATPKPKLASRPSGVSAVNAGKRLSTLSMSKRTGPGSANTSAHLPHHPPTPPKTTKTPNPRLSSTHPRVRQSLNPADAAAHQQQQPKTTSSGKEVFNRGRIEHDEREKMKKEKEEAAKKARAEAAERGRLASREWAEKQRVRKMGGKKV